MKYMGIDFKKKYDIFWFKVIHNYTWVNVEWKLDILDKEKLFNINLTQEKIKKVLETDWQKERIWTILWHQIYLYKKRNFLFMVLINETQEDKKIK